MQSTREVTPDDIAREATPEDLHLINAKIRELEQQEENERLGRRTSVTLGAEEKLSYETWVPQVDGVPREIKKSFTQCRGGYFPERDEAIQSSRDEQTSEGGCWGAVWRWLQSVWEFFAL